LKKDPFAWAVNYLVGEHSAITLEGRIFHSVCIIELLIIGIDIPFNYWIGLPQVSALMLVVFCFLLLIYYFSRFKNQPRIGIILFQIFNCILLVANYYYNSGINGTSYTILLLSFFLSVTIVPQKQYRIWLPVNVLLMLGLLWTEHYNPGWTKNTYVKTFSRYLDFTYIYIITIALISLVMAYIRNAYKREHQAVAQKAEALELSNQTKNKLLSILAHDLKEPLNSIQGFLELLAEYNLAETEKISIEKQLLQLTKDTSHMLSNVLSWTKAQMNAVQPHLAQLDLAKTILPALQLLQHMAKEKSIEIRYNLMPSLCVTGEVVFGQEF